LLGSQDRQIIAFAHPAHRASEKRSLRPIADWDKKRRAAENLTGGGRKKTGSRKIARPGDGEVAS
jgi:hypothetical protein